MNLLVFVVIIAVFSKSTKQDDDDEPRPSTSREDMWTCLDCELDDYVMKVSRLLLAEDSNHMPLAQMMAVRPEELTAYNDELFSYLMLVQFGSTRETIADPDLQTERTNEFSQNLRHAISITLSSAFINHHHLDLRYEYNPDERRIILHEILNLPAGECLCGRELEWSVLANSFSLPPLTRTTQALQVNGEGGNFMAFPTTQYHIIPLSTIRRFFERWLGDGSETCSENNNGCVRILFGRLKRSLRKIVLALLVKIGTNSNPNWGDIVFNIASDDDHVAYSEIFRSEHRWLGGNIFLGPHNRVYRDRLDVFDREASYIIPDDHYQDLENLYSRLNSYLLSFYPSVQRLMNGLDLFMDIYNVIVGRRITFFNFEQWVKHPGNSQSNWEVKRSRRHPRSVNNVAKRSLREKWKAFITYLMMTSIDKQSSNDRPSWVCYFIRLYDNYLFKDKNFIKDKTGCKNCTGFEKYLYLKIFDSNGWKECNEGRSTAEPWCRAWRNILQNIIQNSDLKITKYDAYNYSRNNEYYISDDPNKFKNSSSYIEEPKSLLFEKDVETFMDWLSTKVKINPGKSCGSSAHHNIDVYEKAVCTLTFFVLGGCHSKIKRIIHEGL